jgi:hypothetical protein
MCRLKKMRLRGKSVSEKPKMTVNLKKMPTRAAREQNADYIRAVKYKGYGVKLYQGSPKCPKKISKLPSKAAKEQKVKIKKNVFFEIIEMFLFAIKFCISYNIFSNGYTKFRITYYEIGSFQVKFSFCRFSIIKRTT